MVKWISLLTSDQSLGVRIPLSAPKTMTVRNIFDDQGFLKAYDEIMLASKHYQRILDLHSSILGECKEVIDIGCGSGNLTVQLLNEGHQVTATDSSEASVTFLRQKVASHSLPEPKYVVADATDLATIDDESFDGVSSMIMAHLLDDYTKHIAEAARVLKAGGTFVITARTFPGQQGVILDIVRESIGDQHAAAMKIVEPRLLETADGRSASKITVEGLKNTLIEHDFGTIALHENLTRGAMVTASAIKQ